MEKEIKRAEILVNGLVQGVGFRYFVFKCAKSLGLKGYTKNLFNGEVLTVVEGEIHLINDLYNKLKLGPQFSDVKNASLRWSEPTNEFNNFEIKH